MVPSERVSANVYSLTQLILELVSILTIPNLSCVPNNIANQTMALDYINRNRSPRFYQRQPPMALSGMEI